MTTFKTIEACAVELVTWTDNGYGNMDRFPAQAARVSFANDKSGHTTDQDAKLINYLADHEHLTPFEYQHATLMIECPLFIRSQIHRHRTFSFNEISRRYTSEAIEFWKPTTWRKQAESNRQASDGALDTRLSNINFGQYKALHDSLERTYASMLKDGIGREQARAILPQSLLTRFYMGGNLRNWVHFLKLRQDSHAQYEVQVIANKAKAILENLWPISLEALMK